MFAEAPSARGSFDQLLDGGGSDASFHSPQLDPLYVASKHFTFDGGAPPAWGTDLTTIIEETGGRATWLENAVKAGYVPTLQGIANAATALGHLIETEVRATRQNSATSAVSLGARAANEFRVVISWLESTVAQLENTAAVAMAEANRDAGEASVPWQPFLELDINSAARRARHAMQRSTDALLDTDSATELWNDVECQRWVTCPWPP